MIEKYLSKEAATELFEKECIFLYDRNAVPEYRVAELFGREVAQWIEKNIHCDGYLVGGRDWNAAGSCEPGDPCLTSFYMAGFMKVVSFHNHRLHVAAHTSSEAGKAIDAIWQERSKRLEALDAEEDARCKPKARGRRKVGAHDV